MSRKKIAVALHTLISEGPISLIKKTRAYCKNKAEVKTNAIPTVEHLIEQRFPNTKKIPVITSEDTQVRVNIVTDTVQEHCMFGPVATSLIFATYLANKMHAPLRIVTRDVSSQLQNYYELCKIHNLSTPEDVTLSNFDYHDQNSRLEVSENDIFISTSWWSSYIVKSLHVNKFYIYLLQEYETIFYPNGDEQFLAEAIFNDNSCIPVINTTTLYDYYTKENYPRILDTKLYFEPAFPEHIFKASKSAFMQKEKLKLFFYARPNTPRNMFYIGLRLINSAIAAGIIDTKQFEIVFAGDSDSIPPFVFTDGSTPTVLGKLTFKQYVDFIKTIDVGICLMYAPCPSYPPMDLASSGAVVLTNMYRTKQSLNYSDNIIVRETNHDSLLHGLEEAIALSLNIIQRKSNYEANTINHSWDNSFCKVCDNLANLVSDK